MTDHSQNVVPPSKCPHGFLAVVTKDKEGWHHPLPPTKCARCQRDGWKGVPFKLGGEAEKKVKARRVTVQCRATEGCILYITEGEPHHAPCLIPDAIARKAPPISVEVNGSVKWHQPISGWTQENTVNTVHTRCGKFGSVTDSSYEDLVDCKTCLKSRRNK